MLNAECLYDECRYAKCRGAHKPVHYLILYRNHRRLNAFYVLHGWVANTAYVCDRWLLIKHQLIALLVCKEWGISVVDS